MPFAARIPLPCGSRLASASRRGFRHLASSAVAAAAASDPVDAGLTAMASESRRPRRLATPAGGRRHRCAQVPPPLPQGRRPAPRQPSRPDALLRAHAPPRRAALSPSTQGFHPKPRLVFALSLALGVVGLQRGRRAGADRAAARRRGAAPASVARPRPGSTFLSVRTHRPRKRRPRSARAFYRLPLAREPHRRPARARCAALARAAASAGSSAHAAAAAPHRHPPLPRELHADATTPRHGPVGHAQRRRPARGSRRGCSAWRRCSTPAPSSNAPTWNCMDELPDGERRLPGHPAPGESPPDDEVAATPTAATPIARRPTADPQPAVV